MAKTSLYSLAGLQKKKKRKKERNHVCEYLAISGCHLKIVTRNRVIIQEYVSFSRQRQRVAA